MNNPGYVNERDFGVNFDPDSFEDPEMDGLSPSQLALLSSIGDLGPEGLFFISAADSPNGRPIVVVGNEISGTTSLFQVNVIPEPATVGLLLPALGALALRRRREDRA